MIRKIKHLKSHIDIFALILSHENIAILFLSFKGILFLLNFDFVMQYSKFRINYQIFDVYENIDSHCLYTKNSSIY